jgi:hypothetical protein
MKTMYKIPDNLDQKALAQLQGTEGTFLHPIQDADGNWVISPEEWNSPEFKPTKEKYPNLASLFTEIEFKPVVYEFP